LKYFFTGQDWRIGWNPDLQKGLVGSDVWAAELTAMELVDFCRLALELAKTMRAMAEELSDQESVECELSTERVYLRVVGLPIAFNLYMRLGNDRPVEGLWFPEAVPELLLAIKNIAEVLSASR
jgi:hypothetical protein